MADLEMEELAICMDESNDDFCNSILFLFSNSTDPNHSHLCTTIVTISQELKYNHLPSSPVAYFTAASSSLDSLTSEPNPNPILVSSCLTILSLAIGRVPRAVLKKQRELLYAILIRVLCTSSDSEIVAIVSGLKCLSFLLINTTDSSYNWSTVCPLFNVLLAFLTDPRPEVRRQSHLGIRDVLLNFQKSSLLANASEVVTRKFVLLVGGGEETKNAQKVLFSLDALRECLPLLPQKYQRTILNHFKILFDLRQPLFTQRITDALSFLCLYPASEVPLDALLELLTSLALSISAKEMSTVEMAFSAHLLDAGMKKVYSLNRQISVPKLPLVFNALKYILDSKHEEAIYAATDALKSIIYSCIDASLIKRGVDQISLSADIDPRMSGPTIIGNICATVESLLDYHHTAIWDKAFQVISAMFHQLGKESPYFMGRIMKRLEELHKLPNEDFPFRNQLHECFGSALVAMGLETLLSLIPLNVEVDDLSHSNIWLLSNLKQYIVGARLDYFTKEVLTMIDHLRGKAQKLEKQGLMVSSRNVNALVSSLWSLLPSFCNYPLDTAESFMVLAEHLCNKIKEEEPDICGLICTSLQRLIKQNKDIVDANEQEFIHYSQQVATDNLNVLKSSAKNLLDALLEVFLKPEPTEGHGDYLQRTIGDIASIADKAVVSSLFKCRMDGFCKHTNEASNADDSERALHLDFAVSLLPGLNAEEIDKLYIAIKLELQGVNGIMQKKAYKGLSTILRCSGSFVLAKFDELLGLMVEILPSCHFSGKRYRLDCLYFLINHFSMSKDNLEVRWEEIVSSFLTEIILALKETNIKARNRAYDILSLIGHSLGDEERGGNRENLYKFFNMVAGGLGGSTPQMISATVKALSCLTCEFSDLVLTAFNWLTSTSLLQRKNKEIIKANIGLLKVLIAKSEAEGLQMHVRSIVESLLKWQDNTKNHSEAKLLLAMLETECGVEAVKAVMPEEHMKLLSNIHKIKNRRKRKRGAKSKETRSHILKETTSRRSVWNHSNFFSDFEGDSRESEAEYVNVETILGRAKSSHLKKAASLSRSNTTRLQKNMPNHLSEQADDEPLDLLDWQKTKSALRSSGRLKRKSRLDDEVELDSEGRLIICEEGKRRKEKLPDPDFDNMSEHNNSHLFAKAGTKARKRRKTLDSRWVYTGTEYCSKKAGGDVMRKDKLEPYAYWALDSKMMSRRRQHRVTARKGMACVVEMTKKHEGKSASVVLSPKSLILVTRKDSRKAASKRKGE